MIDLLLYAPQHYDNLCAVCRSAEFFGLWRIHVFDARGLFAMEFYDHFRRRLNRMSGGTFFKMDFRIVEEPLEFLEQWQGRTLAAHMAPASTSLFEHRFQSGDLVVLGAENFGVPEEALRHCTGSIVIPRAGQVESLNVATAATVVLYEAARQRPGDG